MFWIPQRSQVIFSNKNKLATDDSKITVFLIDVYYILVDVFYLLSYKNIVLYLSNRYILKKTSNAIKNLKHKSNIQMFQ